MAKTYLAILNSMFLLTAIVPAYSVAQNSSPYSFGGACGSQGVWTQQALSQAQRIAEVARNLKDDPNCKALGTSMQTALDEIQRTLGHIHNPDNPMHQDTVRMQSIPRELDALTATINSPNAPAALNEPTTILAMNRAVEGAIISSKSTAAAAALSIPGVTGLNIVSAVSSLQRGASTGLDIFERVLDSIPQTAECVADDQSFGQFAAATVQTAAALFSSGQDTGGGRTARLISKLTTMARDYKFSEAIGKLNEQEYMTSISCLLEVTSENYCSVQDTMELFKKELDSFLMRGKSLSDLDKAAAGQDARAGHLVLETSAPFQGYYVLTQHASNITEWLQLIQIGVDPKLPTDAIFKNGILDEVIGFYKMTNELLGVFEMESNSVRAQSDIITKRNAAINMVAQLSDTMGSSNWNKQRNFFLTRIQAIHLPFILIGMNEKDIPAAVTRTDGGFRIAPEEYLRQNGKDMPEFKDPDRLMEIIGTNLRGLIREANLAVIEYHNRWFVVDQIGLIDKSLTSMTYSVKDSFAATAAYLRELESRIEKLADDKTVLVSVVDLRMRIENILAAFDQTLHLHGLMNEISAKDSAAANAQEMDALRREFRDMSERWAAIVVKKVYDEFQVMLARSGFLLNRLSTLVYFDYSLQLKSGLKYNDYVSELMTALGRASFDRILSLGSENPANIQTDLNQALRINKGNLEALELLFRDKLVGQIAKLRLLEKGTLPTKAAIMKDNRARVFFDANAELYKYPVTITDQEYQQLQERYSLCSLNLPCHNFYANFSALGILGAQNQKDQFDAGIYLMRYSERYPQPSLWSWMMDFDNSEAVSPDTQYSTASLLRGVYCTQSLAFNNWQAFFQVCQDAVLESPLIKSRAQAFGEKEKAYLNVSYREKLSENHEDARLNHSSRICAFRDYNRRNLVQWLTLQQQQAARERIRYQQQQHQNQSPSEALQAERERRAEMQ